MYICISYDSGIVFLRSNPHKMHRYVPQNTCTKTIYSSIINNSQKLEIFPNPIRYRVKRMIHLNNEIPQYHENE